MEHDGSSVTLIFYRVGERWWKEPLLNIVAAVAQFSSLTHVEIAIGEDAGSNGTMANVCRVFNDNIGVVSEKPLLSLRARCAESTNIVVLVCTGARGAHRTKPMLHVLATGLLKTGVQEDAAFCKDKMRRKTVFKHGDGKIFAVAEKHGHQLIFLRRARCRDSERGWTDGAELQPWQRHTRVASPALQRSCCSHRKPLSFEGHADQVEFELPFDGWKYARRRARVLAKHEIMPLVCCPATAGDWNERKASSRRTTTSRVSTSRTFSMRLAHKVFSMARFDATNNQDRTDDHAEFFGHAKIWQKLNYFLKKPPSGGGSCKTI